MENPSPMAGPRMVDAHVHIKNPEGIASIASAGIAAVRDAGWKGRSPSDAERNPRSNDLPVILSAGWALYKKGGYGSLLGVAIDTKDEIKSEIHELKNAGAGIIKVIASGLVSLLEPGRVTPGGFDREELLFIVREARSLGLGVMAHANGEAAILAATESGVRSVEHGFFMTERALETMAGRGTYWTPTVGALARTAAAATLSAEMRSFVSGQIQSHIEMIGRAYEMGVFLAVGTDCVLPDPAYRNIYDAELHCFERAGISRKDVLQIACEGGARLLGIE
jgi:imidazolonepropionase-like amidohydrolase